jgi:hypothetical protein
MDDFDEIERMTRAFTRWAKAALIVGLPLWLVLLVVVPRSGLGSLASLTLSTLVAGTVVIGARVGLSRRRRRSAALAARGATGAPRLRAPMSAPRAVLLTLAGVVVVVYVVFILATILRG